MRVVWSVLGPVLVELVLFEGQWFEFVHELVEPLGVVVPRLVALGLLGAQ